MQSKIKTLFSELITQHRWQITASFWREISAIIRLPKKFLQFDWLRAEVFQLSTRSIDAILE